MALVSGGIEDCTGKRRNLYRWGREPVERSLELGINPGVVMARRRRHLILKLLEKDPAQRFGSARQLGQRLREIRERLEP